MVLSVDFIDTQSQLAVDFCPGGRPVGTSGLVFAKCFALAHVFQAKLADVEHLGRTEAFWVGTLVPAIDLVSAHENLFDVFDLGDFVVFVFEFVEAICGRRPPVSPRGGTSGGGGRCRVCCCACCRQRGSRRSGR